MTTPYDKTNEHLIKLLGDFQVNEKLMTNPLTYIARTTRYGVKFYKKSEEAVIKAGVIAALATAVAALPAKAYLLEDPEFYFPITAERPIFIFAKQLGIGVGGTAGANGQTSNDTVYILYEGRTPLQILSTMLHEYCHFLQNHDTEMPLMGHNLFTALIIDKLVWNDEDLDKWSALDADYMSLHANLYNTFQYKEDWHSGINGTENLAVTHYPSDQQKIQEIICRARANVAMNNIYHEMSDIWDEKLDVWATPLYQAQLKRYLWPAHCKAILGQQTKNMTSVVPDDEKRHAFVAIQTGHPPAFKHLNVNLGSWTTQAIDLVYDDILRYDKGALKGITPNPTSPENFNYSTFTSNMLWWIDSLVGQESDWIQDASPEIEGNTAYGYTQITFPRLADNINRYKGAIDRWNERVGARNWKPYNERKIEYPDWVINGEGVTEDKFQAYIDSLTYDQVSALTIVGAHHKDTDDLEWVKLQGADRDAAIKLYLTGHYMATDLTTKTYRDTLARTDRFWKVYQVTAATLAAGTLSQSFESNTCTLLPQAKTVDDVMNLIETGFDLKGGDQWYADMKANSPAPIFDISDRATTWIYKNHNIYMKQMAIPTGGKYKVIMDCYWSDVFSGGAMQGWFHDNVGDNVETWDLHFYRVDANGNDIMVQEYKNLIRQALASPNIDKEELYNSLEYIFTTIGDTIKLYVLDFWHEDYPPGIGKPENVPFNYMLYPLPKTGYSVPTDQNPFHMRTPTQNIPGDPSGDYYYTKVPHVARATPEDMWGVHHDVYEDPVGSGDFRELGIQSSSTSKGYADANPFLANNGHIVQALAVKETDIGTPRTGVGLLQTMVHEASHYIHTGTNDWGAAVATSTSGDVVSYAAMTDFYQMTQLPFLKTHLNVKYPTFFELMMAVGGYDRDSFEEEFYARTYSVMATNRCITFEKDLWPDLNTYINSHQINGTRQCLTQAEAQAIDETMGIHMKLDRRTY